MVTITKPTNQSLLTQFQEFKERNKITSQETALEYFSIFGGLDTNIDTTVPIEKTLEKLVLNKYKYLRNDINNITKGDNVYFSILTGLANGDRRTNSAFRRANISFDDGIDIVDDLCKLKVIKLEKSLQSLSNLDDQYVVSEKLLFSTPFLRFWFAFISPIFKGIRDGDYSEFFKDFENRKGEFSNLIFEQLSHEVFKQSIKDDTIVKLGRYWDDDINIDLLAQTKSGKVIAGACKYTNSKVKKNVLNDLKDKCESVMIDVDMFVLFSKKGYSSELKSLKGNELKLFTIKNFK